MIRIGIICPSEIAFRRFLPALQKASDKFTFVGVAIATPEEWYGDLTDISIERIEEQRTREFEKASVFNCRVFTSYKAIIESDEIDAIYIPLPPALHYKWAKMALENCKHVFVEKPSTCYLKDTETLIAIANEKRLALHENYMFIFHNQIKELNDIIATGEDVGTPRLYRITFGFPRRSLTDFRYNKTLGGGALLDTGGYTIRYATELLGATAKIIAAQVNYDPDFEVEISGTATMVNEEGMTAQLAFGIDNDYRCEIEIWGSKGTITSGRILTAPVDCIPTYTLKQNQKYRQYNFSKDDTFYKSIFHFANCIENHEIRKENYVTLLRQEQLIQDFRNLSGLK